MNSSLIIPKYGHYLAQLDSQYWFHLRWHQDLEEEIEWCRFGGQALYGGHTFRVSARGAFGGYSVFRQMSILDSMPDTMDASEQQVLQVIMTSAIGIGVCWVVGFTLFKIAFYAFLGRPFAIPQIVRF